MQDAYDDEAREAREDARQMEKLRLAAEMRNVREGTFADRAAHELNMASLKGQQENALFQGRSAEEIMALKGNLSSEAIAAKYTAEVQFAQNGKLEEKNQQMFDMMQNMLNKSDADKETRERIKAEERERRNQMRAEIERRNSECRLRTEESILNRDVRAEKQRNRNEMIASKKIFVFDAVLFVISLIVFCCVRNMAFVVVAAIALLASVATFFITKNYLAKAFSAKVALIVFCVLEIAGLVVVFAV